jgi:hypothetical protein
VNEIAEAEHREFLELEDAMVETTNRAISSEEIVEEGTVHPVLIHQEEQFVELGMADCPRVVSQELTEDRTVYASEVFHRRSSEPLGKRDEMVSIQYDHLLNAPIEQMIPK